MTIGHLHFYLANGFRLFPCSQIDKRPLTTRGFKDASLDPSQIEQWYHQHPDCAWGTPTSDAYAVVDVDPRNGGDAIWERLIADHGPIPPCPSVQTGGLGWHHILRFPDGTRCGKIGQGIDLKAEGGYVVIPPSRVWEAHHVQPYRWAFKPWETPIPDAPEWLVALATGAKANPNGVLVAAPRPASAVQGSPVSPSGSPFVVMGDADSLASHPGAPDGTRRVTLCRLVGSALGGGVDPETVHQWAKEWASRCSPPFDEWERHVVGLVRREGEKGNNTPLHSPALNHPTVGEVLSQNGKEGTNSPSREPKDNSFLPATGKNSSPSPEDSSFLPAAGKNLSPEPEEPDLGIPMSGLVGGERREDVVQLQPEPDAEGCIQSIDPFTLPPDAYHGVLGGVVKAVSPHTEADDPAVMVCMLTAFGSAVGFNPHFNHGKAHGCNLFAGLVGPTASRKGTATSIAKRVIADTDPDWEQRVQHEGFGSGEGLIWSVRDPNPIDPVGIPDKRLLVIEEEWAKAFTLSASDKSILTPLIRNAFDRIPIGKANKGDNAYRCEHPHISVIGNITPDDLRQSLTGKHAVSIANGFVNRFLLVATRRTKYLPRGGRWKEHAAPFIPVIRDAIQTARGRGLLALDGDAEGEWDDLYAELEARPEGVAGAATARASDMVMKLAMIYALADKDNAVRASHLRAGLAVWRYCEATAFALFGEKGSGHAGREAAGHPPTPDPLWLRLLNAVTQTPGVKRSELVRQFREPADAIGKSLDGLRERGLAHPVMVQNPNGGPKAECWYPGSGEGEGDEPNNQLHPSPDPIPDPADLGRFVVEGGVPSGGRKEGTNFLSPTPEGEFFPADGRKKLSPPPTADPEGELVPSFRVREITPPPDPDMAVGERREGVVQHPADPDPYHADRPDPDADPDAYDRWLLRAV